MKLLMFVYTFSLLICCIVLQKDTYEEEFEKIKAEVGESVTLSCRKPEIGSFSAAWSLFPGNESLTFHKCYKDRLEFTNNSLSVTITNLTKEDSGVYCCALKTVKKTLNRFIMLHVIEPCSSEVFKASIVYTMGILNLVMEILRIICLITLSILLGIAVKTSC